MKNEFLYKATEQRSDYGTGCFGIEVWVDRAKFTNVRISGFG